jgi:K+-transporting ATPase ATPase C chain
MKTILQGVRTLLVLTALTGAIYPLAVTAISSAAFPAAATGSILHRANQPVGSALLAQKTENPRYFWPRPSGGDWATIPSGASNKGPTSADLAKAIAERRTLLGPDAPEEMLTSSGSGLDPHLSPPAARFQAARVAQARGITVDRVNALIAEQTEQPQWGFLGEARVNILALNLALDASH